MRTAEDWNQMARQPWETDGRPPDLRDADVTWAMVSYLAAIFLGPLIPLGPVVPLMIWLTRRNRSAFARYHAGRALNLSVTGLIYAVCCVILGTMLALDTITLALAVALPLLFVLWLVMLKYLIRGVFAAQRGEPFEVPAWICSAIVR